MDTITTAPLFVFTVQPRQHPPPLELLGLSYRTESMAFSMREMGFWRAERARGPRSGVKSTMEEISLVVDRGDCLATRRVQ